VIIGLLAPLRFASEESDQVTARRGQQTNETQQFQWACRFGQFLRLLFRFLLWHWCHRRCRRGCNFCRRWRRLHFWHWLHFWRCWRGHWHFRFRLGPNFRFRLRLSLCSGLGRLGQRVELRVFLCPFRVSLIYFRSRLVYFMVPVRVSIIDSLLSLLGSSLLPFASLSRFMLSVLVCLLRFFHVLRVHRTARWRRRRSTRLLPHNRCRAARR